MIIPDINLILYANLTGFREHKIACAWWEACLNGDEPVGLVTPVIFGFIRLSTNPRLFGRPMPATDALRRIRTWLDLPHVHFVVAGPRHLDIAFGLLESIGTAGSLTTGVQIAAVAIEHQAEAHSADADFARFPGLRWRNPLQDKE
jgi:toxin-antitoxin system PIN domain toxin